MPTYTYRGKQKYIHTLAHTLIAYICRHTATLTCTSTHAGFWEAMLKGKLADIKRKRNSCTEPGGESSWDHCRSPGSSWGGALSP